MFDKTFDDFTNFGYTALNCPQCGCSFEEKISAQCDLHEILVENECVCKENMVKSRRICVCDDGYILENDDCIDIDECLLDICSKAWYKIQLFYSLTTLNLKGFNYFWSSQECSLRKRGRILHLYLFGRLWRRWANMFWYWWMSGEKWLRWKLRLY